MRLAARVNRISISPTAAVLAAAERLRVQGADLADFGPGEPDFPTPAHIQRAAIRALEQGRTKYTPTPGIGPLREAICKWHAAQFGSSYAVPECISGSIMPWLRRISARTRASSSSMAPDLTR